MQTRNCLLILCSALIFLAGSIIGIMYGRMEAVSVTGTVHTESTETPMLGLKQVIFPDGTRCIVAIRNLYNTFKEPVAVSCDGGRTHE